MEDNKMTKKIWQTPEIIDLDVEKTKSGAPTCIPETTLGSCAPSAPS
jgi:hypothetical protein